MLSGDNGVLQRATDAKTKSDEAQIRERIQLAYHSALTGGQGSYTKDTLMDELKKEFETDYDVDDSDNKNWKMKAHGQEIIIPAGKQDNQNNDKVTIKVGTTNLKEVSDLTTLYGETTDYSSVNGVQWQLFYDDNSCIYLIASDYVPISTLANELLPNELLQGNELDRDTFYESWFTDSSYAGTIMTNAPWNNGVGSSSITSNPQTNSYLKWVNSSVVNTSNNPNIKAVAFMMDRDKWSNFKGIAEGAYAIGGPTLEMFVKSYNASSSHTVKLGTYETVDSSNANESGYKVKIGDGSWSNSVSGLDTSSDNMWVKTSNTKATGMWLAAPSSDQAINICCVNYNGQLTNIFVDEGTLGFRPLVSIPKSSIK